MDLGNIASLSHSYPELILGFGAIAVLLTELFIGPKRALADMALWLTAAACLAVVASLAGEPVWLFNRMVAVDPFALFFKLLVGAAALGAIWMSIGSREMHGEHPGEFYSILMASTLGLFYMVSATNLLMAYLAFELVGQTSYILAGFRRRDHRGSEAALKYLIYGGVASGTMLYGMSLIYGLTGSLDFRVIGEALSSGAGGPVVFIAAVLMLTGFCYKIAAVPFHMWTPDVYEGAPLPVTAYLAVGSKVAGFALLIRFFYTGFATPLGDGTWGTLERVDWPGLMILVSMVTMTLGNLTALRQESVKRMFAYSAIAHAGYALLGFAVLTDAGLHAVMFYMVVYYLMKLGAFAVLGLVMNQTGREDLASFRGLAWRGGELPAAAMLIFLFSLAGIPPFAGFVGKMYLFAALIETHHWVPVTVAAVNAVVALYYYARLARVMYMQDPTEADRRIAVDTHNSALIALLVVGTVVFGVYWQPLAAFTHRSLVFIGG